MKKYTEYVIPLAVALIVVSAVLLAAGEAKTGGLVGIAALVLVMASAYTNDNDRLGGC